jgi:hypothetical protein
MNALIPSIPSDLNEAASIALSNVLEALTVSDGTLLDEGRKTVAKCESVGSTLMLRVADMFEENRTLQTQLVLARSQQQETKMLDQAIVTAAQDKAATAQSMVATMQQEMIEASHSADARIELLFTTQTDEVQQTRLTCDAQLLEAQRTIATLRRELAASAQRSEQDRTATRDSHTAAVLAAKQAAGSQISVARLEVEQLQHELVKATHQADERVAAASQIDDSKLLAFIKKDRTNAVRLYRVFLNRSR